MEKGSARVRQNIRELNVTMFDTTMLDDMVDCIHMCCDSLSLLAVT